MTGRRIEMQADDLIVSVDYVLGSPAIVLEPHPENGDQVVIVGTPDALRSIGGALLSLADDLDGDT